MWEGLAAFVFKVGSVLWCLLGPSPAHRRSWHDAVAAAGLTGVEERRGQLCGRKGGLRIALSRFSHDDAFGTCVSLSGPVLASTLTLRPEGMNTAWRRLRGWQEIEVGDTVFDRAVWVEGPPVLVRALLDADTRQALLALFRDGRLLRPRLAPFHASGRLEQGVLRIELTEGLTTQRAGEKGAGLTLARAPQFNTALLATLALAERLASPQDPARRIADELEHEPLARVRLLCLTTLLRELPDHPATRQALLAARQDPDARVRLRAGTALGAEGRDVLLSLARGEGAEDGTTAEAVTALGDRLTVDQATAILRSALRTRRQETARVAMGVLAHRGGPEAIRMIARVLAVEHGPLANAAASTLGLTGNPLAEEPLLAALAGPDSSLRVAATRSLGKVGTVAAVEPLRELEARDSALRVEARLAIARIQSRVAGASPGQLSLAGGESGQLSFAEGEAGRLSLPEAEAGRLALSPSAATALPRRRPRPL